MEAKMEAKMEDVPGDRGQQSLDVSEAELNVDNAKDEFQRSLSAIDSLMSEQLNDKKIVDLNEKINKLRAETMELEEARMVLDRMYQDQITPHEEKIREVKDFIAALVPEDAKEYDIGGFHTSTRVTKSLVVVDKKRVVDVLVANDKVEEGVSGFVKGFLRKLKEVGLIDDQGAKFEKKKTVKVTLDLEVEE